MISLAATLVEFEDRSYGRDDYCWAFITLPNGQRCDLGKPRLHRRYWPKATLPVAVERVLVEAMEG